MKYLVRLKDHTLWLATGYSLADIFRQARANGKLELMDKIIKVEQNEIEEDY